MHIDVDLQKVSVQQEGEIFDLSFDRLVFTAGSALFRPDLTGLHEYAFSTDTYRETAKLDQHIQRLPQITEQEGKYTAIIIGGGVTGIEVSTEVMERLKEIAQRENKASEARLIVEKALHDLYIEIRTNQTVRAIDSKGVTLETGERIASLTTIWSVGVKVSRLAACFPVKKDALGRLIVDPFLQVEGLPGIFAAGDTASAKTDDVHVSMMSCQHAIPQGKLAGHNVVCDLLGMKGIPYRQEEYVTCLDLGAWGALYTKGWERIPVSSGQEAKKIKQMINRMISPSEYKKRDDLFASSRPVEFRMN
ncbi:NAD(P)/FAD-dependent oxidoreductase [Aneurinibacillus tyrosinisolvens]|uniref:NAD(P)/FAD-dependent oxidoreductase n=1 Tax=Aneurinibacillus tyrosinisolvens TaxID=1443435 RepID=UPI00069AA2E6